MIVPASKFALTEVVEPASAAAASVDQLRRENTMTSCKLVYREGEKVAE